MTEPATDAVPHARPAACENCGTVLQGHYCHVCGQRAHNPLRHFGHAVEDVFESFWHLDGRIFRTLRDLLVPGRVAANYLDGHRVRYIAPLRLFVVLTVLAFFVGHFAVRMERPNVSFGGDAGIADFARADTVEAVDRIRESSLAALRSDPELAGDGPIATIARDAAEEELRRLADARIRELRGQPPDPDAKSGRGLNIRIGDEGWDPRRDKVAIPWLPESANLWLQAKAKRAVDNAGRISSDPEAFKDAWMRSVPTMLFLLVPIFALLLKLAHPLVDRGYLEHLVIALYSHAWLMLALLLLFLGNAASDAGGDGPLGTAAAVFVGLLWVTIPLYLLLMQKRVYRQSWWLTLPKYLVLGTIHTMLMVFGVVTAMAVGLVRM